MAESAAVNPRTLDTMPQTWKMHSIALDHIYDSCAQAVYPALAVPENVGIVASSAFHARELSSRCKGAALIFPSSAWYDAQTHPYLPHERILSPVPLRQLTRIIWAAPTADNAAAWIRHIDNLLARDGELIVVFMGLMAFRLPEYRTIGAGLNARAAARLLRENGYVVRESRAFHGLESYTAAFINVLMTRLNKPDLADRWKFRMHAAYPVRMPFGMSLSSVGYLRAARK